MGTKISDMAPVTTIKRRLHGRNDFMEIAVDDKGAWVTHSADPRTVAVVSAPYRHVVDASDCHIDEGVLSFGVAYIDMNDVFDQCLDMDDYYDEGTNSWPEVYLSSLSASYNLTFRDDVSEPNANTWVGAVQGKILSRTDAEASYFTAEGTSGVSTNGLTFLGNAVDLTDNELPWPWTFEVASNELRIRFAFPTTAAVPSCILSQGYIDIVVTAYHYIPA